MSTPSSMTTSRWNHLKQTINFYPPQNDDSFFWSMLQSLPTASGNGNASYRCHSNAKPGDINDLQQMLPLLSVCHYNQIDLCELLMTQYQQSHLSLNAFISRCWLFRELEIQNISIQHMFTKYMQMYSKHIASPLQCINPSQFTPFNDSIDIVLSYLLRINQCIHQYTNKTRPMLFDVYFVPPTAPNELDFVDIETMVKSEASHRCNIGSISGLDDICSLFANERAKKMLSSNCNKKRYILLIDRKNEHHTNGDRLYLFEEALKYDLDHNVFLNNDVLWHILSKQSDYPSSLNVSYHVSSCGECRMYSYYKGFGSRMMSGDLVKLFINGKNKICNEIKRELKNAFGSMNPDAEYLFGLRYDRIRYCDTKRRILYFPKNVLKNDVPEIRELDDPQKQLYYFLSWTCKMQVIDGEFMEYRLNNECGIGDIAIFNSELHSKYSFDVLYVVSVLNEEDDASRKQPKWRMNGMMTSHEIYNRFGIDYDDLPIGSRYIHNSFNREINGHNMSLQLQNSNSNTMIPVCNWKRVPCIQSQKYCNKRPNLKSINLNNAIKESMERIRNKKDHLSLIPILTVNLLEKQIECDTLIPIRISSKSSYIAVAYRINDRNKAVVTNLYIDCDDIINKAALVDPYAYCTYQWLKGDDYVDDVPPSLSNFDSRPSFTNNDSGDSQSIGCNIQSPTDSWLIESLYIQKQLNDALEREQMLWKMLQQKDQQMNQMRQTIALQAPSPTPNVVTIHNIQIPSPNTIQIPSPNNIYLNPSQTFPQTFPLLTNNNSNNSNINMCLTQTPESNLLYTLSRAQQQQQ